MSVTFRHYAGPAGITEDYYLLRDFFLRRRGDDFPFGRWDWMITHGWLDHEAISRIGIWEEHGKVVGVATFDTRPGEGFILVMPGYENLRAQMVRYAARNLRKDGKFRFRSGMPTRPFSRPPRKRVLSPRLTRTMKRSITSPIPTASGSCCLRVSG